MGPGRDGPEGGHDPRRVRIGGRMMVTIGALAIAAGTVGFTFGLAYARLDESDVLARYAAHYAAETGGDAGDCIGLPGEGRVWLRVVCTGEVRRVYAVSRWGLEIGTDAAPRS